MKLPWNREPEPPQEAAPPSAALLTALSLRMDDAIQRLEAIERTLAEQRASLSLVRVEWAEVLDKINHWASRQAGRLSRKAQAGLDALANAQDAPQGTNGEGAGTGTHPVTKDQLRRLVNSRMRGQG